MTRPVFRALAAMLLVVLAGGQPAAAADLRLMEAVGALPIDAEEPPKTPPRDTALRMALEDAVWRVASELAPELEPIQTEGVFAELLGKDPFAYATRFRILEDRGERPALFTRDQGAEREYVVVVEVYVDADRVRDRLVERGLVSPSGELLRTRLFVTVESPDGYEGYEVLRRALVSAPGVRSAVPVEMDQGRVVLEVDADREAPALLESLQRTASPELVITPLAAEGDQLALRVSIEVVPAAPPVGARGRRGSRRN